MTLLEELVERAHGFASSGHRERIKFFGWYLHTQEARERFDQAAIRRCYNQLHMVAPDLSVYFKRMVDRKPPDLLLDRRGYRLAKPERDLLEKRYGKTDARIAIETLIAELPRRVPGIEERAFLSEVISCLRVRAFRATIVMVWNLALDHLMRWILEDPGRLAEFNNAIRKRYPKKTTQVGHFDDFEELKEAEVIEIAQTAGLISGGTTKILRDKLSRRNSAAHPSSVMFTQFQAEDAIADLVNNVVLKLT